MRFTLTIGRVTLFDFSLFRIDDPAKDADVVVVHHQYSEDEDEKDDGPGTIFGGKG